MCVSVCAGKRNSSDPIILNYDLCVSVCACVSKLWFVCVSVCAGKRNSSDPIILNYDLCVYLCVQEREIVVIQSS